MNKISKQKEDKTNLLPLRKMFSDTLFYSFGGALPKILSFLLLPVYSRLLSPRDFGILAYVASIIAFLTITNCLSLNSYYIRYYFQSKDKKELTGSIFYFLILINLVFIVGEGILLKFIFYRFNINIPFSPYMLWGLIGCFFSNTHIIPLRYYRLAFKANKYVGFSLSYIILAQIFSLYLIYFHNMGAEGRLLGDAISAAILAILLGLSLIKHAKLVINIRMVKRALKFSLPLMFSAYAIIILSVSDRVILERFTPMSSLGIYSISYAIASITTLVIGAFWFVVEPMVYKIADSPTFMSDYLKLKNYFFFVVFLIVGMIVVFSKEAVDLLLPWRFSETANLIPIIAFFTIFIAAHDIYTQLLLLKDKTVIITAIRTVGAIINVVLNLIFIPKYGIYAAATTTVFAYFASAVIAFIISSKEMKMSFNVSRDLLSIMVLILFFSSLFILNPLVLPSRIIVKMLMIFLFFVFLSKNYSIDLNYVLNLFLHPKEMKE